MKRSIVETVMGALVLVVVGVFMVQAYKAADLAPRDSYPLVAKFTSVDGLTLGSDVRLGGVKIGTVIDMQIDPEFYEAVVTLSVDEKVRLPDDSVAAISSDGLLGGKYVKVENGASDTTMDGGATFASTRDVVVLEELLGRAIFLVNEE